MQNSAAEPLAKDRVPAAEPEIDYTPKKRTLREQIVLGLKFGIGAGLFLLAIWLVEHQ